MRLFCVLRARAFESTSFIYPLCPPSIPEIAPPLSSPHPRPHPLFHQSTHLPSRLLVHSPHSSPSSPSLRPCTTMAPPLVYMLPLTDTGAPDIAGDHISLPPPREPYTLRIAIEGASSITRNGSLWTDVPAKGEKFGRNKFREFKFVSHLVFFSFFP